MDPRPTAWLMVALLLFAPAARAEPAALPSEPPAPQPASAVQRLLDEANGLANANQLAQALSMVDRSLAAAREAGDLAGIAESHRGRAMLLAWLERAEEAISAWQAAAAAWERLGDGPGQVEALAQAGLLRIDTQPTEVESLFGRSLTLGRAESRRPLAAAAALQAAGQAWYERGLLDSAREFFTAALSLREARAPGCLEVAESLNGLGAVTWQKGNLTEALRYYQQALVISERLDPDSLRVAISFNNLGNVAAQEGDLAAARHYFQRSLAIKQKRAPNSLTVAVSLDNLGNVVTKQGNLAAARQYHGQALALREKLAPGSLEVAASLNNLGIVAKEHGDLAIARQYHQHSLAIKEALAPHSLAVATSLENLGNVAGDQGDLVAARQYHERALAIKVKLAPDSLQVASSLSNLGAVAGEQGDLTAAEQYHRQALALRQALAPRSLDVAISLENLANVAFDRGDLTAARRYEEQALLLREALAPRSLDVARSLSNLGRVALAGHPPKVGRGDLVDARRYYQQALTLRQALAPLSLDVARSLHDLGLLAQQRGRWSEAEHLNRLAWGLVRRQAAGVIGDEARQAFGSATALYAASLIQAQVALGKMPSAFATLEEGRAQSLLQLLAERGLDSRTVSSDRWSTFQTAVAIRDRAGQAVSEASITQTLARRRSVAEARGVPPAGLTRELPDPATAAKQFAVAHSTYVQARLRADQLWSEIRRRAPRTFVRPLLPREARKALPRGTLFVAFSVGEEKVHLFLMPPSSPSSRPPPLSAYALAISPRQLKARVSAFLAELTALRPEVAPVTQASRDLFARLFPEPARRAVLGAQRLLISPDGPLWDVPFAALVTNRSGAPRYLGAKVPMTYTQSLTLFVQSRQVRSRMARVGAPRTLIVGDCRFAPPGQPPAAALQPPMTELAARALPGERALFFNAGPPPPLPATLTEATSIARLYGSTPLLAARATEAALRQRIATADLIHLATHGVFHRYRAMSSGLLLSVPLGGSKLEARGSKREARTLQGSRPASSFELRASSGSAATSNDGVLQAWEIFGQLKLRAELVVLSACDTGRGQNVRGEGIVGMTRALQYAGARSIVASQWKVADASTARLMVAFHHKLLQGLAKDEALRQAMATVRRDPRTAHPYYWAPFFLTGDPENPRRLSRR